MADFDVVQTNYQVRPVGAESGVKAQNAEWFASDIATGADQTLYSSKYRIFVSINAAKVVEVTVDSGTTWVSVNGGVALVAGACYTFDIPTRSGDTFNMRIPTSGGATVNVCRVDEIFSEG